ncbi:cyclic nucleotide-binding and patatin-like phospholipase domain-containing protein [Hyphomicrobium sp.]|uniref:cyclic nucleotide-binding and patatin-like phospholipase domain-containing protein n=1 Tax=Hyphomicrobium sp. TaxID=82 RepID=UPI0025C138D6|nr:cyclic nucleotide-binding and patatin-like phospholipase domain-containing protein [Hyphomicrobium sp.]MCC7254162.1 cyclic nucleotide-binding domain-containing protein [Hyphomicrobium sp.]
MHESPVHEIPDVDLFSGLSETERRALAARLALRTLRRGDVLMRQGDAAEALYVVVSGRFAVTLEGRHAPVTEIGPGQPAGEIAFLTGGTRTATVTAMRDSLVLALSRAEFDALVTAHPGIWGTLTATLARRLAATTSRTAAAVEPHPRPRTICVIPAGSARMSAAFVAMLGEALDRSARSALLTSETAPDVLGVNDGLDGADATARLNALEAAHDHVLLVADDDATPWTEKAIRHADLVLAVASHADDAEPNAVERLAARFVAPDATRLVLLHPHRGKVQGTARWLGPRQVAMHHHVALDGPADVDRLMRFIEGRALGFVAAGGGALAAAHTGVFKALSEAGLVFDIMGGTSAGAALAAAFLLDGRPDDIDIKLAEMFVTNRALRRYTLPRYALLDHTVFDSELKRLFGNTDIEDLWLPFFAVSTNLSRFCVACHRTGPLWRAIRASASIPVLLPPVYTADGDMLVDGCLLDNVPVKTMGDLKAGPNVIVSFKPPTLDRYHVDYEALPSRAALIRLALNPLRRDRLPDAPGLVSVLMRALMANRRDFLREIHADDVSLQPPIPQGMGFLDWHRHRELFHAAYRWTHEELAARAKAEPPAWLADALARR